MELTEYAKKVFEFFCFHLSKNNKISSETMLSVLFLDYGKFTFWTHEYYFPLGDLEVEVFEGNFRSGNWAEVAQKVIQLIEKYKINYVVLERGVIDRFTLRSDRNFEFYLLSLKDVIAHCHRKSIRGAAITPTLAEVRKWRERTDYCWRQNWKANEYWCDAHKRIEKAKVPALDEVDVRCIREKFWITAIYYPHLLKIREKVFNSPMIIEPAKTLYPYQQTKTERLDYYARQQQKHNKLDLKF